MATTRNNNTFSAELLRYVQDNPGVTGGELRTHFSDRSKNTVSNLLQRFRYQGFLENRGRGGRGSKWYPTEPDPVAPEFATLANQIMTELRDIYPVFKREAYLAHRLQGLFVQEAFKTDA